MKDPWRQKIIKEAEAPTKATEKTRLQNIITTSLKRNAFGKILYPLLDITMINQRGTKIRESEDTKEADNGNNCMKQKEPVLSWNDNKDPQHLTRVIKFADLIGPEPYVSTIAVLIIEPRAPLIDHWPFDAA